METPKHWTNTTVGAICTLTNGMTFKSSEWRTAGLPIIRIQNLNNSEATFNYYEGSVEDRFRVSPGDLLFAWSGTPGTSFGAHIWQGPEAVLNQHIFKVTFDRKLIDPDYLCYAINQTLEEQTSNAHGGVGLRHVTKKAFSDTRLPLPPYEEQKRLAKEIRKLRAQSAKSRNALKLLIASKSKARESFLEAAFAGDLTRDWQTQESLSEPVELLLSRVGTPKQAQGGREATSRVVAGRSGVSINIPDVPLPNRWAWVSLLRIARQETGHTPSRRNPEYWGGTINWLGIKDANAYHGKIINNTLQKITEAGLQNSSARLLPAGTVCLSRTASVGYVTILGETMATSQDFATWTCSDAILPEYLMYALMSEGQSIRRFGEGSVHTTIYFPEIRAFHIRLAPIDEQAAIVSRIKLAFSKLDQVVAEAEKAMQLFQQLDNQIMEYAFKGKLTKSEAGDGSAVEQLSQLRPPIVIREVTAPSRTRNKESTDMAKSLLQVLSEANDWLPAQEVFQRCGIGNGADMEKIEQIFAELRSLDQEKKLLAEPILDSNGRKIQDRLRLVG